MTGDELYEALTAALQPEDGVSTGTMFGAPAFLVVGKAVACIKRGYFAAKLGAGSPEHAAALRLAGSELFDPSGKGRPFRDWVAIPVDGDRTRETAEELLRVALARSGTV